MSIRAYVRVVEVASRQIGITLSMAKLRDAITKALHGRSYSSAVAADDAGKLPAITLPPPNLAAASAEYGLAPEHFGRAFKPSIDRFDGVLQRMDQFLAESSAVSSRQLRSTISRLIGYKQGRYWSALPLVPSDIARMVAFYERAKDVAKHLGPEAITAAHGVMRETVAAIPWDHLETEEVFLTHLRRYVATAQGPVTDEHLDVLAKAGHLVRANCAATGAQVAILTLVHLPSATAPEVPQLYDVVLEACTIDPDRLPVDDRKAHLRAAQVLQSSLTPEQRQCSLIDAKTAAAVNDTVTMLSSDPKPDGPGQRFTLEQVAALGECEPIVNSTWSVISSGPEQPGSTKQSLHVMRVDGASNGSTVGSLFHGDGLTPELCHTLLKVGIPMTWREHLIYWFVFGFDSMLATSAASRMRLTSGPISHLNRLRMCLPMAAAVRYASTMSPAIVIGFDDDAVDAIVIAPAMLNGTRRFVIPRRHVTAGHAAFGKAIRAKAKLLDYELDDPKGWVHDGVFELADSFSDAHLSP